MYLSGIISEILLREGVIHGDPNLRHFILMPKDERLQDVDRDGKVYLFDSRNGLGVIDCENARIDGKFSSEVKADVERFKDRLFSRYTVPNAEKYFDIGADLVKNEGAGISTCELAYNLAKKIFKTRFSRDVKDVDMRKKKVTYL